MPSVTIIGAGIAGPAAALRFSQCGYHCKVYERASSAQTIGGAVNLAPNGLRLFDRLGVLQEITRQGCTVESFQMRNERGAILGYFPNSSADGYVGVRIMRATLQAILLSAAKSKGVDFNYGMTLKSVAEKDGKVIATFSNGTIADGDYLVGADGIHSTVRQYVAYPKEKEICPRYTGTALVYGILDANVLPTEVVSSMHATSGVFGQKGFFASAFCDNPRTRLYWISSVTKAVAEKLDDPDEIRSQELSKFGNFYKPIPEIIQRTAEFFSWPIYELPFLEHWVKGKVVLIGDAAHALPPDKGQGVSQAIEDVFVLARVIESGAALARYEEIRQPRIEKLRDSIKNGRKERERGLWEAWFRDWIFWIFLKVLNILGNRLTRDLFGYDPDIIVI